MPPRTPAECWFCLASPQVEKHLLVAIGSESYIALPKGGINDSHVLIVPIAHHDSLASAPSTLRDEVNAFLDALATMFAAEGKAMIAFERVLHARRGETPVHTHVQVIGVPAELAPKAESTFTTEGSFKGVPFERIAAGDVLLDRVTESTAAPAEGGASASGGAGDASAASASASGPRMREYLYAEVPAADPTTIASKDGKAIRASNVRLLHLVPPGARHPVQFGREVLCRLLNCPDRLMWKTCAVGAEKEGEQAAAFRQRFAPFDFTGDV